MKILVLGAAGMIGRKLIERLLQDQQIGGKQITSVTGFDVIDHIPDVAPGSISYTSVTGDICDQQLIGALLDPEPELIFHMAAIVSGEAEADFEKGYRINLKGTQNLFDGIVSREGYVPRVVYASSIAVFGAPFPEAIEDDFHLTPLTSYGTQKAIGEMLLADFSRKGHMDGIGLRFPTIVVRPGKPNAAASGFFSNIIREPLNGERAVLPVEDDVRHWVASPRSAVQFCIHAALIDGEEVGPRRNLTLPGLSITVGEMVSALERVAGKDVAQLIDREADQTIRAIVANWPRNFNAERALELGFRSETAFDDIIRAHMEDEMNAG